MDPVTFSITIARPREQVFEYLADIANHAEFTDHYIVDWHLTREDTYGHGAGARYKLKMRFNRFPWGESTIVDVEPHRRIVEVGRTGKFNRVRTLGVYTLDPGPGNTTRLTFTFESRPKTLSDRLLESLGGRGWFKRKTGRAMRRLRSILEEGHGRGKRPTIAGGPRKPATGFRI